jgi:hypothetical protein
MISGEHPLLMGWRIALLRLRPYQAVEIVCVGAWGYPCQEKLGMIYL